MGLKRRMSENLSKIIDIINQLLNETKIEEKSVKLEQLIMLNEEEFCQLLNKLSKKMDSYLGIYDLDNNNTVHVFYFDITQETRKIVIKEKRKDHKHLIKFIELQIHSK